MKEQKDRLADAADKVASSVETIASTGDKITEFLVKIVGDPATQLSGIASDWLSYWRYKNLLSLRDKVEAIHAERRLDGRQIPLSPKYAVPIIEAASLEDDEALQDLWAALLANATDPNHAESIHPAFAGVIKELCADEALIVAKLALHPSYPTVAFSSVHIRADKSPFGVRPKSRDSLNAGFHEWLKTIGLREPDSAVLYRANLERLKILETESQFNQLLRDGPVTARTFSLGTRQPIAEQLDLKMVRSDQLRVTSFGEQLLVACGLNKK